MINNKNVFFFLNKDLILIKNIIIIEIFLTYYNHIKYDFVMIS